MIVMPQHHFGKDYFEGSRSPYKSYLRKREKRRKEAKIYLKHLTKYKSHGRLLEVGCAYGFYLEVFKEKFEVFGMDISEHAIQQARRFLPEVRDHLIRQDCQKNWPYVDNYFDAVVAYSAIEYLEHPLNMIRETYRCLKPGGVFMFSMANPLYEILPRLFPHLFLDIVLLKYRSITNVNLYLKYSWELKPLLSDFLILEKIENPWIGKLKILERKFRLPIRKTIGKLPIFNSTLTWICSSKKTARALK